MNMKGYALLVGVDEVNHVYYGENKKLCSSYTYTENIKALLNEGGYESIVSLNKEKTNWSNVVNELSYLIRTTNNDPGESYIFIYFSGHGASIEVSYSSKRKQFLCFYDQLILEDSIRDQLSRFNKRCKIFVVLDSCHADGVMDQKLALDSGQIKSMSEEFYFIYKLHQSVYDHTIDLYKDFSFEPNAEIFSLLACGENEETTGGFTCKDLSYFTKVFCNNWYDQKPNENYLSLYNKLRQVTGGKAKHRMFPATGTTFFSTTYPLIFK